MSSATSTPTVFELVDEIVRPLTRAVAGGLPEQVAERLPDAAAGPGRLVRIPADPLGRVSAEHARQVAELRELAARPRLAGRWVLFFTPATRQHIGHWIRQSVQAHLEPARG